MKKILFCALTLSFLIIIIIMCATAGLAVEIAPRISDREIVERLSRLEEGQKKLENRLDDQRSEMNKRFDDLRSEINSRFESVDKRFDAVDKRFDDLRSEMNGRFNLLTWIFGLYITISMVILGFVIRTQWQMQKMQGQMQERQTQTETSLQIQGDEVKFLKDMIMKLFPPKGAL